jgi:SH3-like domain-containing protein
MRRRAVLPAALAAALALSAPPAAALDAGRSTGLPVPRFVSVKAKPANVRVGPGTRYPVKWIFVRRGVPVEIVAEYDNWRKIRDADGQEGWILGSLLSGRRSGLVAPWSGAKPVPLRADPESDARITALVEPKVLVRIEACDGQWCEVSARAAAGYVRQSRLWGAYPGEAF